MPIQRKPVYLQRNGGNVDFLIELPQIAVGIPGRRRVVGTAAQSQAFELCLDTARPLALRFPPENRARGLRRAKIDPPGLGPRRSPDGANRKRCLVQPNPIEPDQCRFQAQLAYVREQALPLCRAAGRFRKLVVNLAPFIDIRSEEHTSELQSLMRISYAVFCLNKKTTI